MKLTSTTTTTTMSHPHNANPETYAATTDAVRLANLTAYALGDMATRLCFETIEVTDARHDAIAVHRAVEDLKAAAHAALLAVRKAADRADERAATLARIEGRTA